jgi:exodeoxyribonuclease VII large subunit
MSNRIPSTPAGSQSARFVLFITAPTMKRPPFNPNLIEAAPAEPRPASKLPLSVSQLTAMVKRAIQSALPATVHVVGEISNLKRHSSGHVYLTLKDDASELSCVMWRADAAKLKFSPKDGLEVVATGTVEVFERTGRYQLYIRRLEPRGVGALQLAFRQLCERLGKEGLFDERHKKPLPAYPRRIVIVTSPTGAALADLLRTIERRYPCVHVLVFPVRVQGDGAAGEIATAIRSVNAHAERLGGVDVIIIGRGGGSIEDLWAFNEEVVARAIHASTIPIISAVGHEVDVTIADLVADVRAATPTAAAEIAVPVLDEVLAALKARALRVARAARVRVDLTTARLKTVLHRRPFEEPLHVVRRREQVLDELAVRSQRSLVSRLHDLRRFVDELEPVVQRIAPHTHLFRTAGRLAALEQSLRWMVSRRLAEGERSAISRLRRLERISPRHQIARHGEHLARLDETIPAALRHRTALLAGRVSAQEQLLIAVSHRSVLARGFSITRTKKGRRLVRSVRELEDRQRLVTQLAEGEFESETLNVKQLELFN